MKILIVEDEKLLADSLRAMLEGKGFTVEAVYDGETGAEYAETGVYDLLILDVMMPVYDGWSVLRHIRSKNTEVPVMMLTARTEENDEVFGFDLGADDYIMKPFDAKELVARVKAVLRRYQVGSKPETPQADKGKCVEYPGIEINLTNYSVIVDGHTVEMPPKELEFKLAVDSKLDPDRNLHFEFDTPLASADTSKIHLYAKHDTLWYVAPLRFEPVKQKMWGDSIATAESKRQYILRAEWRPGIEYSLEIDSLAFTDIYGNTSRKLKKGFKVGAMDDYSSLVLNIAQLKGENLVVELLTSEDKAVKNVRTTNSTAAFYYVRPGKYYARLFVDRNNNGVWDTGDYSANLQPEEVFYYPYEIECKAKWDVTLNWNINEKPLDQQKPEKIKKQKGERQRKIQQRNMERARKMGIAYPF